MRKIDKNEVYLMRRQMGIWIGNEEKKNITIIKSKGEN